MQKYFADQLFEAGKFPFPREVSVDKLCQAMSHEVHELQNLTNWKWWKKDAEFDEEAAKEELIDILHFVIHTAIVLGMTSKDFLDEYNRKMEINKQRQKDGY
jgi:dimeric dUTPase (all-alpha-NTP-PPase superfamily)